MNFCDNLLKSFIENLKQLTKMNDFYYFLRFHENVYLSSFPSIFEKFLKQLTKMNDFYYFLHMFLHCFHGRYEFCMQKYPSKCIFIEFP